MFNKRTVLISLGLFALINSAPVQAKPTTVAGKIGAGLVQLVNRHSYLLTLPLWAIYFKAIRNRDFRADDGPALLVSGIAWFLTGKVTKTVTGIIMDANDIQPVKE